MQENLIFSIKERFDVMVPQNRETLLILAALQSKIDSRQIEDTFTQRDFDETIEEVGELLERDQSIQKESISKKLSQYFYTTLKKGNEYRYQLTVFARELVSLVINEIEPQFDDIELIHTFERTLKLTEDDLNSIRKFEYWYANHFKPSKRIVLSHTENLQRLVDSKIVALRELLKTNADHTKELINSFIDIFETLGKQTEGLTNTLAFKQDVIENIKHSEERFMDKKIAWEKYSMIRLDVERFFENIDFRVLSINDRIQASTSRLKTLYDTLRYKQLFKLKLEKFQSYLLKNSKYNQETGGVILPKNVETRIVPYFKEKFHAIPNLNFSDVTPREVPDFEIDKEHLKQKEKENMRMLNRQESVTKWLESMTSSFDKGETIQFDKWFKDIYKKEQNLEVPIDVCFGLIQRYGKDKNAQLIIDTKDPFKAKEDLALWKLKIQNLHS